MDSSVTSVDTLVYQLEDEDPNVRWATLQRLRKRAAVERAQLPVRNPRRFLHCLRRRLSDDDVRIARETLLLLRDVVDVLGSDVDQILSSVLPHLVARLPLHHQDADSTESALDEDTFSVFRKYANVTSDLAGVANLLMNMGLAHSHARVREAALLALVRLLDERHGAAVHKRGGAARVDAALFTELVQAAVPALEDADEGVVVAAEEAVAKIQLFWGPTGFQDVMPFLSTEDKATLQAHAEMIRAFGDAASNRNRGVASSVSASQVLALRTSLPTSSLPLSTALTLRFGFVTGDVVDALEGNRGNSNTEWKKRTAAVEQLYAAAKQVTPRVLVQVAANTGASEMGSLMELLEILVRLLHDIDVHLVKRSLQILRLLFYKLEPKSEENDYEDDCDLGRHVERVMPALVETAANYVEDDEITTHMYTLFQTLFSGQTVGAVVLCRSLRSSLHHRRLQVREEALKIWIVLLLTTQHSQSTIEFVKDTTVLHTLGKLLADGSARVRYMAMELAAVLGRVTRQDVCALVESHVDDFTLERINLDALYARSLDKRLPTLLEDGQLRLPEKKAHSGDKPTAEVTSVKAAQARSPVRTSTQRTTPEASARISMRRGEASEWLDGPSELFKIDPQNISQSSHAVVGASATTRDSQGSRKNGKDFSGDGDVQTSGRSVRDEANYGRSSADPARVVPTAVLRDVSSAPGEPVLMSEKLQALKKKSELLKKSASSKQVRSQPLPHNRSFNPQDGECEFASAGYAAQQQPPSEMPAARPSRQQAVRDEEAGDEEDNEGFHVHHRKAGSARHASKALTTPREEDEDHEGICSAPHKMITPRTPVQTSQLPSDERPIRPMRDAIDFDEFAPSHETTENRNGTTTKRQAVPISLATKKRLEARQRQEPDVNQAEDAPVSAKRSPDVQRIAMAFETRKRQDQSADDGGKPSKRSSLAGAGGVPPLGGKQEPRYLEPHELQPLPNAKQDAMKLTAQLCSPDWETVFDALTTVRRLARHHTSLVDDKVHAVVTEILKHVPNLRSSVAKNALLALDSLCLALGKQIDSEVDSIIPVLFKRCTDSNAFVCESTTQSIHRVITHCTPSRVVPAIAAHLASRAVAIRREVARSMHAVIVHLGDHAMGCKEFPAVLQVVGKCLEDSNNEVRDAAKQSVLYLYQELHMDGDKIKKMLPTSVHAKVDPLLTRRTATTAVATGTKPVQKTQSGGPTAGSTVQPVAVIERDPTTSKQGGMKPQPVVKAGAPATRRGSTSTGVDADALASLGQKLDSSNWKDRFDALSETSAFITKHSASLCESGKILTLFDGLIKRIEDGNAKVSTLALELLPQIITSLGDGMELVLQTFVPAIARGLAASQAKQATLALTAIHALCTSVDARLLCPHIVSVARHANSRIKPTLLDVLVLLAAKTDEKNQFALTRYVLPLALDLLKEGKSDVKDGTVRLLRTLYESLGDTVIHAGSKLSAAQQDKLSTILGTRAQLV